KIFGKGTFLFAFHSFRMPLYTKHKCLIGLVFEFQSFNYLFIVIICIYYQVVTDRIRINSLVMGTVYLAGKRTSYLVKQRIIPGNDRMFFIQLFFFMSCIAIVKILDELAALQYINQLHAPANCKN